MRFIFSPTYNVETGGHVFPARKFSLVAGRLKQEGVAADPEFIEPGPPAKEELLLAHTPQWVEQALSGALSPEQEARLEMAWSPALARAHALAVSGTILACRLALEEGAGLHVGGGAHHAFPDHGEGFCAFNDIACGILCMRKQGRLRRAAVVDLDVHQGNGTNAVFCGDKDVRTFSMHQRDLYPEAKTPGSVDIELEAGTGDEEYLRLLEEHLPGVLDLPAPELVVYQAGVDVYREDLLGGLALTFQGLRQRDAMVFEACAARSIPVVVTLGGGYARRLEDTVALHAQTLRSAKRIFGGIKRGKVSV